MSVRESDRTVFVTRIDTDDGSVREIGRCARTSGGSFARGVSDVAFNAAGDIVVSVRSILPGNLKFEVETLVFSPKEEVQ